MTPEVDRPGSASEFLETAGPLLLHDEARHNLILGIASTLRDHPDVYPRFHLWVVSERNTCIGAALMTEPFNLILADATDPDALEALVHGLDAEAIPVPGVVGNQPHVRRFADHWSGLKELRPALRMSQGVYSLHQVHAVPDAPGRARAATSDDRDLLISWLDDFAADALTHGPNAEQMDRLVDLRLSDEHQGLWFWEDGGEPVSLAGYGASTPSGVRLGPVYTPMELRRHGYATSLVAEMTRWLLDQGRSLCFLYTNLANPTSNAIYERIGYERVCESAEYGFEPVDRT